MPDAVPDTAPASEFANELLARLVELGLEHVVLSPGSRSQALALAATQLEQRGVLALHVRVDERVAGFLALGVGQETRKPAAVITSSGTAVANLHPAVLEAYHAGVPLILLTADRPEEAHGIGANQTMDQRDIFGAAVRLSIDEPAPVPGASTVRRAADIAELAWTSATDAHAPGPVHLNLAFREPLASGEAVRPLEMLSPSAPMAEATASPAQSLDTSFATSESPLILQRGPRTIVIAGADAGPAAEELAHQGGWPLIAEVSSGSRFGRNLIIRYRELLQRSELRAQIERIIVFGHPTLSREVPHLIADTSSGIETFVVRGPGAEGYNPGHNVAAFTDAVEVEPGEQDTAWLSLWVSSSRTVQAEGEQDLARRLGGVHSPPDINKATSSSLADMRDFVHAEFAASRTEVTRELLVDALWRVTWPHDRLMFAASRIIRVADSTVAGKKIPVFANRGLAGIDGTIATATGIALASAALTRVVVGDLATVHDVGALALGVGERSPRLQVIVGNDGGGTLFETLEVAQVASRETMIRAFLTPQQVKFEQLAAAYGWNYVKVTTVGELERALTGMGDVPELVEVMVVD